MEELNLEPMVVLFHDAISDDDIQRLKDATIPYMERAVVVNHDEESRTEKGQNYSDSRISETAWLNEGDDPDMDVVLNRLTVRMNHMSGKRMMTSESLQVNNYGIGGYFAPHFDAMHYNKAAGAAQGGPRRKKQKTSHPSGVGGENEDVENSEIPALTLEPLPYENKPRILLSGFAKPLEEEKKVKQLGADMAVSWRDATHLVLKDIQFPFLFPDHCPPH
ncbi:uncharacterized protein LOC103511093 [Diaphorina citri]|uniref:Uncharacterized protein LOC103511093 n=1 Tax=Diaphorina citri TaxID=121845 RepID=A0A3Q0IWZ3_DIACI|nr:uncharacterized protein LOC103511093 [Diaphorina citri]